MEPQRPRGTKQAIGHEQNQGKSKKPRHYTDTHKQNSHSAAANTTLLPQARLASTSTLCCIYCSQPPQDSPANHTQRECNASKQNLCTDSWRQTIRLYDHQCHNMFCTCFAAHHPCGSHAYPKHAPLGCPDLANADMTVIVNCLSAAYELYLLKQEQLLCNTMQGCAAGRTRHSPHQNCYWRHTPVCSLWPVHVHID